MMRPRYVALLRAISNVAMQPFRTALEELGFTDVGSYGMSGNLLFNANSADTTRLEHRIAARLGTVTLVRSRPEIAKIVGTDPFHSSMLFLSRLPTAAQRRAFLHLDFAAPRPLLRGRIVYFVYPPTLRGKRAPVDLERALGVQGTARSARVVRQVLARMTEPAAGGERRR